MKRSLKSILTGIALSAFCLPTLLSTAITSYAGDADSFAGGNNSYTSGSYSNSNQSGWGITFNTSGGTSESRVIGAKISIYYTTDVDVIEGASSLICQHEKAPLTLS
ncbi:MAG: hypothetical protein ACI4J2_12900 [Ruminococcus sp.]